MYCKTLITSLSPKFVCMSTGIACYGDVQRPPEYNQSLNCINVSVKQLLTVMCAVQLEDNIKAIEVVKKLTPEIMQEIDDIVKTKPEPASTYGR